MYYIQGGKSYYQFKKGYKAIISSISPGLFMEVRKARPEPLPPVVKIAVGDGTFMDEENKADPGYKAKYEAWQIELESDIMELMIELGAVAESIDQPALQNIRRYMKTKFNVDLSPDDNYAFLKYVAISSDEEYNDFCAAIAGRSKPTEGAIANAIEGFSSTLQG
jgi:hypothetical protein